MKMNKCFASVIAIIGISTVIFFIGCSKSSSSSSSGGGTDNSNAASLSANGASADNTFDDALNVTIYTNEDNNLNSVINREKTGSTITNGSGGQNNVLGNYYCATITVVPADTVTYPKTITVDFGAGCTSADSIVRSGSFTYTLSERFRNPGAVISVTFNNYVVNGYGLAGTYTVTNNSSLSAGVVYTTAVTNGVITYPNDTSYSFTGTKTVTQTAGIGSTVLSTYVFSVVGNYTITNNVTGETLSAKVTTPLVKDETCPYIVSGTDSFTYTKGSITVNGTFDYGSGTCDNAATVTIGSTTWNVTLH
jgi:hypothetical protein